MKKITWALCLLAVVAFTFTSCSDDDDDTNNTTPEYLEGAIAYTAGAGNYNQNNGTVGAIMQNTLGQFTYSGDLYQKTNGRGIGDAQDVLLLNGKLYVACTSSSKIEILKDDGTIIKTIPMANKSPRYLATDGSNVYASAYSGYVYKLSQDNIVDSVEVGSHPEALSVANGKLYVNMSDYNYDNTGHSVSVINLSTFKKTKEIDVALNPYNQSIAVGNNVYIVSVYHSDRSGLVQRINATTDQVDSVCNAAAIAYNPRTNSLVCLDSYYVYDPALQYSTQQTYGFFSYNLSTRQTTSYDLSALKSPSQVNVDPATGNIYVIDNPSYTTPSVLYIYDQNGKLLTTTGIQMDYSVQNIRFIAK